MTLLTKVTGDFNRPFAKGRVTMPILRIPALTFENVVGNVTYQDGILNFENVSANVYSGKLEAKGVYNLDTRAYTITGVAKDLDSSVALKAPEFLVPVSANLNFKSEGQPRDMEVWGNFWSGEGHYMLIPIQSITGNFHNKGRHLSFNDVKVNTKFTTISTDARVSMMDSSRWGRLILRPMGAAILFYMMSHLMKLMRIWLELKMV